MDYSRAADSEATRRFVAEAGDVHRQLAQFIRRGAGCQFVSLGQNCTSAWYLKQLGLKSESYPFDWNFSSPEIILDCLRDGFAKYLERSLITPKNQEQSAGHQHYHADFFHHRNPLKTPGDYEYYVRCCERMRNVTTSDAPVTYVVTLINEPHKRPIWTNGFRAGYAPPSDQNLDSLRPLLDCLIEMNPHAQFVVVDHYTEGNRSVKLEAIADSFASLRFEAAGASTGACFSDPLDDFCFKLALSGLSAVR